MKPPVMKVTDPAEIARILSRGKYREHLPHFVTDGAGLLVEKRESVPETEGEAK